MHTSATKSSIYLYTISTATLVHIAHPAGMLDYYPAVSTTGTLYWGRSGPSAGSAASLMKLPLGGTQTNLNSFNNGNDLGFLQTYNDGSNDQVFYTRFGRRCAPNWSADIYRITTP